MNKIVLIALFVVVIAAHLFVCGNWQGWDDAFITYRYAENNAAGHWFHWNAEDPPTYGVTSFLWMVILTAFSFLKLSLPVMAIWTGLVCHALAAYFAFRIVKDIAGLALSFGAGLLVAIDGFGLWATVGMETYLFIALALAAVFAYQQGKLKGCGWLCGALVLARPDGIVLPILLTTHYLITERKIPLAPGLRFFSTVFPWAAMMLLTFGTLIPNGLEAKQVATQMGIIGELTAGGFEYFLGWAGYALLAVAMISAWHNRRNVIVLLFLFAVGDYLLYVAQHTAGFSWYIAPPFCLLWIVAACVPAQNRKPVAVILVGISLFCLARFADADKNFSGMSIPGRDLICNYLQEHSKPGEELFTDSVGELGYRNPQIVVRDIAGIVSPELLPITRARNIGKEIERTKPAWIFTISAKHDTYYDQIMTRWVYLNYEEIMETKGDKISAQLLHKIEQGE